MQNTKNVQDNTQSNIQIYEHDEFGSLQVLMIDGKPFFPAVECAEILGYIKPHNAISRHCVQKQARCVRFRKLCWHR